MELWSTVAFLAVLSSVLAQEQLLDLTSRNFTPNCLEMSKVAKAGYECNLFMTCCNMLAGDKMNGDKCQLLDPMNRCAVSKTTGKLERQCLAYNCTKLVTTTTTTTTPNPAELVPKSASLTGLAGAAIVFVMVGYLLQRD